MKRLAFLSALLAVLVGIFVVTAPGLVSIPAVRRSLAREIAGWGGSALTFDGAPTVAFRPFLTISFPNARIVSARTGSLLVSMEQLSAQVPLLPLLFGGNIEPTAFDFRRPDFHFEIDGAGALNWTLPFGLDATTRVEKVRIRDGALHFRDASGHAVDVEAVDARLSWPGAAGAASIKGRASWRGQAGDFSASLSSLRDFFDGKASDLDLTLASSVLDARFNGSLQQSSGIVATGSLSAEARSIRDLAGLFGPALPDRSAFGAAAIKGELAYTRGIARLADASISFDGNDGEGVLALDLTDQRPALHATLAFDDLEIAPFAELAVSGISAVQQAPDMPIDFSPLSAVDLDVRLSADKLLAGGNTIGRVAGSAALRSGRLDVALADLRLFDGRLSTSLSADSASAAPSATLDVRYEAMPLKSLPGDWTLFGADGTSQGAARITLRGNRWRDWMTSLAGSGDFTIEGGRIDGLDLAALKRSIADPAANSARIHSRSTGFDRADVDYSFDANSLMLERAVVSSKSFALTFSGSQSFADGLYHLAGLIDYSGGGDPSEQVPFIVDGGAGLAALEPQRGASSDDAVPGGPAATFSEPAVPKSPPGNSGL